jgi:hypothetical protein
LVPGLQIFVLFVRSKGANPNGCASEALLVLDVELFGSPSLVRICHLEVEITGFRTDRYDSTANVVDFIL